MASSRKHEPLILASQSPRRSALLREAGIAFEAVSPKCEEPCVEDWPFSPHEFAQSTSYLKVRSISDDWPDRVILGADTVVALDGKLFGKAADRDDARRILEALTGVTQDVITGITLYEPSTGRRFIDHAATKVTMREMSDEELKAYLDSGEWAGKAGAYGIQGTADRFVTRTEGSFSNVVGLPVEMVVEALSTFGIEPDA